MVARSRRRWGPKAALAAATCLTPRLCPPVRLTHPGGRQQAGRVAGSALWLHPTLALSPWGGPSWGRTERPLRAAAVEAQKQLWRRYRRSGRWLSLSIWPNYLSYPPPPRGAPSPPSQFSNKHEPRPAPPPPRSRLQSSSLKTRARFRDTSHNHPAAPSQTPWPVSSGRADLDIRGEPVNPARPPTYRANCNGKSRGRTRGVASALLFS